MRRLEEDRSCGDPSPAAGTPTSTARGGATPWLLFGIGLIIANVAAIRLLDHSARAGQVLRNPRVSRGWPEYVKGPSEERNLVVLIGNSQAWGVGRPHDDDLFVGRLRKRLAREGLRFENWSCPGLGTREAEILGLQAMRRNAALVVFSLVYRNLALPDQRTFDPTNDIELLGGEPWFLTGPGRFHRHPETDSTEDLLRRFGNRWLPLLRSRSVVVGHLTARSERLRRRLGFAGTPAVLEPLARRTEPAVPREDRARRPRYRGRSAT